MHSKIGFYIPIITIVILSSSLFLFVHEVQAATVPDPPTGFNAIAISPTTVNLSWNPPQYNGSSAITGYKIEYKTPTTSYSSWPNITPGNVTKYNVTGLTTGTSYIFRVSAINAIGTGNPSPESVATPTSSSSPPKNIPPNPPTGLVATASSGTQVNLSWNPPTSNGGYPVSGYKILYNLDSGSFATLISNTGTTATAYSHTGLSAGHTYTYQVFAINSAGTSNGSNTASAVPTFVSTAPYPPAGLVASTASPTSISLSWTTPSNDGGSPIIGYKIEAKIGTAAYTVLVSNTGTTSTSYVNSGLITGTTYTYRVSAINSIGTSGPSNEASATPAQTLTPTGVTAVAVSPTEIDLSWIAPSQTYGQSIGGYRIDQKFSAGSFATIVDNTGQTTSYQIKNLITGKAYTFVVVALFTEGGSSNPSPEVSATPTSTSSTSGTSTGTSTGTGTGTTSTALPDSPTGLNLTKASPTSVMISWITPSNNGKPSITGYKIEYKIDTGAWTTLVSNTGITNSYLHTGILEGSYTYRVSSINSVGTGNPSAVASITLVHNVSTSPPIQSSGGLMVVTGTSYSVNYNIIGGKVTGMSVDPSTFSLQVQMQSTANGTLSLNLPRQLIDAKKSDGTDDFYLVTADKQILKFTETKTIDVRALTIDIPSGTSQVEIYGTHVVPEFPITIFVLVVALTSVIIFSRKVIR